MITAEAAAQDTDDKAKQAIIDCCRSEMGGYGAAAVKFCIDQDLAAGHAHAEYYEGNEAIVKRCWREMGSYGWGRRHQMPSWGGLRCAPPDLQI
jgi:hypothetical protein